MSFSNMDGMELDTTRSNGSFSARSSVTDGMIVDRLYISLNEIDSANARIKKQLTMFGALDSKERKYVRDLLEMTMKSCENLSDRIQQ